jgi:hypothetical protein
VQEVIRLNVHIVYALLLLGHVLGDFYFQSDGLAEKKCIKIKYMFLHGGIYTICIGSVLCVSVQLSRDLIWLTLFVGVIHFIVDALKKYNKWKPFILDQLLHLITLGIAWAIWGGNLQVHGFVLSTFDFLPSKPAVMIILGFLYILKPVGLLIGTGEIWDFNKGMTGKSQNGAGKIIGYLERCIAFFLLINGQYSAVGFIIAAKSVIRFPEINRNIEKNNENRQLEKDQSLDDRLENSLAEYYLIGTLLSLTSACAVSFLI